MRIFVTILSLLLVSVLPSSAVEKSPKRPKDLSQYIAIFDFDVVGRVDKDISRPLSDTLRHTIVKSGAFKVMDRANMDRILKEQAFQMTGGVQKDRAVEAGQFLGVGKIVIGSIGLVGRTYMISISLVNIESGETERVEEDNCKCELDELIESVKRAANKLMSGGPAPQIAAAEAPSVPQRVEPLPQAPVPVVSPSGISFREPTTGMDFVLIKGGCFQMGDVFEDGDRNERPAHEVCVDDFYLARYEATQGQWKAINGKNPAKNKKSDQHPVEDVNWNDVQDFIKELNQKTNRSFRLPTEAEWEYAARGGGQRDKWSGASTESDLDGIAWHNGNSGRETHPVGQKRPNALGLYDMTGNVWEWVSDTFDSSYYKESPRSNPGGPGRGRDRVFRGGSYKDRAKDLRTFKREKESNRDEDDTRGFRLALPAR
jgi:formylglycine-generating enzyme required for sulfatase activity/TolB-like protein